MKLTALIIALLFSISSAYSQTKDSLVAPWWVEKFRVGAGFFLPVNSTKVQVGLNGSAAGTEIDFKKDLGYNATVATFLAGFEWRISRRSRISLAYLRINRSNTHTLQRDITFKDSVYHAQASVNTFFNTSVYVFSYGYAFIVKPNYEVGVSFGAHTLGSKAGISLNNPNGSISANNDFGFTAPLPNFGIWGGYAFSDRFAANMELGYLSLTFNNVTGKIITYNLVFTYKVLEPLDVSLAYTGLNIDVTAQRKGVTGEFKWGYYGPSLSASFTFGKKSWTHTHIK